MFMYVFVEGVGMSGCEWGELQAQKPGGREP